MKSKIELKILALDSIVQIFLQILLLSLTSRYVMPEDYGAYALAFMIINLIKNIGLSGISTIVLRKVDSNHISAVVGIVTVSSIILMIPLMLLSEQVATLLNSEDSRLPLFYLSSILLFTSLSLIIESFLIKVGKVFDYFMCNILAFLVNICMFVFFINLSSLPTYLWLTLSYIVSILIKFVILMLCIRKDIGLFNPIKSCSISEYKLAFSELSSISVISVVNSLALNIDTLIVSKFLGASSVGLYARAYQLGNYTSSIYSKIISKLGVKAYSECSDEYEIKQTLSKIINYTSIISVLVALSIHLNSGLIVDVLFGLEWAELKKPLSVLILSVIFRLLYKSIDTYLLSFNLVKVAFKLQVLFLINVIIFVTLSVPYGLLNVCYAIVMVSLIQLIYSCTWLIKNRKIEISFLFDKIVSTSIFSIIYIGTHWIFDLFFLLFELNDLLHGLIVSLFSLSLMLFGVYVYFKKNKK